MHEDIERMIDIVSQGETITKRQREIIRSRAQSQGIDPDEAEILLELRFSQKGKGNNAVQHKRTNSCTSLNTTKKTIGEYYFHNTRCVYKGQIENGIAEGEGVLFFPDKYGVALYKGEFHKGNRHGFGILFLDDGVTKCYEGDWFEDRMEGEGVMYWDDGFTKSYEGDFVDGYYEGKGVAFDRGGRKVYEGDFHHSDFNGKGIIYKKGEKAFDGDVCNGIMIRGSLFRNGEKIYDGVLPPTEEGIILDHIPLKYQHESYKYILLSYLENLKGDDSIKS